MSRTRWQWRLVAAIVMAGSQAAWAQVDLTGYWGVGGGVNYQDWQLRIPGPDFVDYSGLPINDAARTVALSHNAEELSLPERQCMMYSPVYLMVSPGMFQLWPDFDPNTGQVIAWNTSEFIDVAGLKIWMDGRSAPSEYAAHPVGAFTVGKWEGDILTTTTTHMRRGYLRRNGVPHSDRATMTLRFMRDGNLLTITGEVNDPVYLTEPYIYSRVFILNTEQSAQRGYPSVGRMQCRPAIENANLAAVGTVPHYATGKNAAINELTTRLHVPHDAAMGGAQSMYPEFRKRMQAQYVLPDKCERYCCGWDGVGGAAATLKSCPTFFVTEPSIFRVAPVATP